MIDTLSPKENATTKFHRIAKVTIIFAKNPIYKIAAKHIARTRKKNLY